MSERAKEVAKTIEDKVRKATGNTPVEGTPPVDPPPADENPPAS